MNWLLVLVTLAGAGGSFWAYETGRDHGAKTERNNSLERRVAAIQAREESLKVVAEAIKEIKIENKTIVQRQREIQTSHPVFTDCRLPDESKRLLDSQLRPKGGATSP